LIRGKRKCLACVVDKMGEPGKWKFRELAMILEGRELDPKEENKF
jgi:hypothetical protein